jgi:hypothetical protein
MKSFDEPWWMLDGWEEDVVSRKQFLSIQEAQGYFDELAKALAETYKLQKSRGRSIAFWNEGEMAYCSNCEEELQVYHGILWLRDKEFLD